MLKSISITLSVLCGSLFSFAQQMDLDSLMKALDKAKEDTGKVTTYRNLSVTLKFTDPAKAIEYGQRGIILSKKLNFDYGTAGCYLGVSTGYIYSDKLDTALLFLDTALLYAHKANEPNRLGLAYLNRADIYRQLQNFNQSLKDCETALQYADKANNDDVRARVNQTFGAVYYRQENYPQGIIYYNKAYDLYHKTGNLRMSATVLNNLGLIYKNIKDFQKSATTTLEAIRILDSLKDITNLSIFNGNLCDVYLQMGNYGLAEKYADKSMEYAVMQQNETRIGISRMLQGEVYLKQNRIKEAIDVVNKALPFFKEQEDFEDINIAADLLAEAYALTGNYSKAYEFIKVSRQAKDSVVKQQYSDDIAAMQAKFKVDEKDKEIQLLAKDKELQQQKLKEQKIFIIASIALAILALLGIWLAINRYRLRQKMKELELRNQIAADLHDEVGSSLSSIHMLSQMANQQGNDTTNKDILTRMSSNAKETMDKMSDIVWMIKPGETEAGSLKQRMERFAYEVCSSMNIESNVSLDELEKVKLSMDQRKNIYLIFKEALNNAAKYSGANKIDISVNKQEGQLSMMIKDNGKGFDIAIAGKGNGLQNMKNRAKELGGSLLISSAETLGTTVRLNTPLKPESRTT